MYANYLILVNKNFSARTRRFWKRYKALILSEFADADLDFLDSDQPPIRLTNREVVILIGDVSFFSRVVNCYFDRLADTMIALIPDKAHSELASNLQIPAKVSEIIKLVKCRQAIPLDVIRCHYIDMQGLPANCIVLNDIVIGISPRRFPLLLKTIVRLCKYSSWYPFGKRESTIALLRNKEEIYRGKYLISLILLGNTITYGPTITQKKRINLNRFDYFQLNPQTVMEIVSPFTGMFSEFPRVDDRNLWHRQFSELEIRGLGRENNLIADGICIGRLPASFTLLPKALRVISPLNVVTVKSPWKKKAAFAQKVPTPIGSKEALWSKPLLFPADGKPNRSLLNSVGIE